MFWHWRFTFLSTSRTIFFFCIRAGLVQEFCHPRPLIVGLCLLFFFFWLTSCRWSDFFVFTFFSRPPHSLIGVVDMETKQVDTQCIFERAKSCVLGKGAFRLLASIFWARLDCAHVCGRGRFGCETKLAWRWDAFMFMQDVFIVAIFDSSWGQSLAQHSLQNWTFVGEYDSKWRQRLALRC